MADKTAWVNRAAGVALGLIVGAGTAVVASPDQDYHGQQRAEITQADVDCFATCARQSVAWSGAGSDITQITVKRYGCDLWEAFVDGKRSAPKDELPPKSKLWTDPCGE